MEILLAKPDMIKDIQSIFRKTITTIYPKYYPKEVVEFFYKLYARDHVLEGIDSGNMRVLIEDNRLIGVGCYDNNHITGVYILPEYQNKGYGNFLIEKLEEEIFKDHDSICLEASLPAASLYEHRGYKTTSHGKIDLENDVKLIYEIMEKEKNW